jgi:hypothetical protein
MTQNIQDHIHYSELQRSSKPKLPNLKLNSEPELMLITKRKHSSVKPLRKSKLFIYFRGSYAARDLTDLLVEPNVNALDFVYTKFVNTLIVIVPLSQCADFQRDHAMISDYVIPGSAKRFDIPDKDGLTIW